MAEDVTHPLLVRRDAAQATMDAFSGHPFAWGKYDCGRMLAAHLRAMGHLVGLHRAGSWSTLLGARRALRRLGYETLSDALDARFARIAPAAALVGDVLSLPSEGPLDAIAIALGNGRAFGYHEDVPGAVVLQPVAFVAAWRVEP